MAVQALFFRTCNLISNTQCLLNIRPLHVNLLPLSRGLKQETVERIKTLKIPEKPKKPASPYVKFVIEQRPKIIKENPNFKQTEIIKQCAEDWKNVSSELKEKYNTAYKSECEVYNDKIMVYNSKLSPEQKVALENADREKRSDRKKRKIRKVYRETNKPKRPAAPYSIFIMEQSKIRNVSAKELMTSLRSDWANLSETEKAKYKNQFLKEKEKYEAAMAEWEAKMVKEGRDDLVRVKTVEEKTSRIRQLKKGGSPPQ